MDKNSDNNIDKIKGPWTLIAFLFKYRAKELLAFLFVSALVLNLADVNIKEIIGKLIDKLF